MRRSLAILAFPYALAAALLALLNALPGVHAQEQPAIEAPEPPTSADQAPPSRTPRAGGGAWGRRFLTVLGVAGVALVGVGVWAFWFAGSSAGSSAYGVSASVDQVTGLSLGAGGVTPTSDPNVPLAWNPALLSNGHAIDGYLVRRYVGSTPTSVCGSDPTPLGPAHCTDGAVPDGTYAYGVSAKFASWTGPESSRITVQVDTSAPSIDSKPQSPSANPSPTIGFSHPTYSAFKCDLDGGGFASCTSPDALGTLADGSHTFGVEAVDGNGHPTQISSYTWTIDTSAPALAATPSDPSANTTPSFPFTDSSYSTFKCRLDGGGFGSCSSPDALGSLPDGLHTIRIEAFDADHVATQITTFSWHVSTGAPTFTAEPSNPSASTSPAFAFHHPDYSSFVCRLDGSGSFTAGTCSPSGLSDGNHTLEVEAKAGDGSLTSAASYTWKVSTAAPTIPTKPHSPSANPAPAFGFHHGDYSTFVCQLDTSGSFTSGQCSPGGLSSAGHTLDVKAQAADGSQTLAATYAWTVDTSAPTITAKPHDPSANKTPSFGFSHAQVAYTFKCQTDAGGFGSCTSPTTLPTLGNASHTFQVEALDQDGFATPVTGYTWTVDATPPTITGKPTGHSANASPSFSFTHAQSSYTFRCQRDGGGYGTCTSPQGYGGLGDGSHEFDVQAVDADGVVIPAVSYSWTIDRTAPTIKPATTMLPGGTYASQSAGFNFVHTFYSSFACFLDGGSFAACTLPTTFSGLADGSHTVTAAATDADGATTNTATFTWTVKHAGPTLSAFPANPTKTTSASFTFAESPYTTFQCSLDGVAFAACTSPKSYTGLSGAGATGTSHTFKVHAADALGTFTADTVYTWTVDTTAPTVDVEQAATQSDPTSSQPIHFTATFDEPVNAFSGGITIGGTAAHGTLTTTVTQISSTVYDISTTGFTGAGTVTAVVRANATTDLAGNNSVLSTSSDNSVTYTP